jgi:hypothetical protein
VTTFDEVRRLAAEVAIHRAAARDEPDGELSLGFREAASEYRAEANRLLDNKPLETYSAEHGPGILVGVDHYGQAVFHPDSMDTTVTVPMTELREPL